MISMTHEQSLLNDEELEIYYGGSENVSNYIKHCHGIIVQKIAVILGLPKDLSHHHSDRNKQHHERVNKLHKKTNNWYYQHNKQVTDFHKNHALKIERGENRNGLLSKSERFVYAKVKALFKNVK